jgi:hypothetical protein
MARKRKGLAPAAAALAASALLEKAIQKAAADPRVRRKAKAIGRALKKRAKAVGKRAKAAGKKISKAVRKRAPKARKAASRRKSRTRA